MSTSETANLIDFSMEDDGLTTQLNSPQQNTTKSIPSDTSVISERTVLAEKPAVPSIMWLSIDATIASPTRRESFDNNPFDRVEKLANRPNDPFENMENEVNEKQKALLTYREVELGNLLSISDDNFLNDDQSENIADQEHNTTSNVCDNFFTGDNPAQSSEPNLCTNILEIDSSRPATSAGTPQSFVNTKSSGGSASSSGNDVGNSSKPKKAVEHRKRLLKLSLTNSAQSSPVSRNVSQENVENCEEYKSFSKLLEDTESSIKISDDLMSEEPNWIDSEKDFEAELEMLNIPMLKELTSSVSDNCHDNTNEQQQDVEKPLANDEKQGNLKLTDLDVIRSKLKAKQNENNNDNQDISKVIDSLKSLLCNCEGDTTIQQQANSLLDTLSTALGSRGKDEENAKVQQNAAKQETLEPPPQAIVRQGTFDIDLQENNEIPEAMAISPATDDGEMVAERADFILPEAEPRSPQLSQIPPAQHIDINDIAEQIGKLLGLHQVYNNETSSEVSPSSSHNPTVIVVMNTTPSMTMQQSTCNSSHLESSTFNDDSPDLTHSQNVQRRRSQSLSIHDKIKVLHLPLKTFDSNSEIKSSSRSDIETSEFKTPNSKMRRSSFSNAIHPVTPHSNNTQRRMSCASDGVTKSRHNSGLSTHHEQQQQYLKQPTAAAVVHPMPQLPDVNTKRRLRSNSSASSILKSTGPMKATIPMKKVSPMLKSSPHTPEDVKCSKTKTPVLDVPTGFPNASSTPAVDRGHLRQRSSVTGEQKPRFSYLPTTPTGKQTLTPSTANAGVKRRTITEFKSKSPIKPRVSTATMNSLKSTNATTTKGKQRSPLKKTVTKGASSTAKNTVSSTRTSNGGATGPLRSKENKKP